MHTTANTHNDSDGPAVAAANGARIPVEAHLRRVAEVGGPLRHGRVRTDDLTVDFARIAAHIHLLRIGDRAASFDMDRIPDHRAHITGIGHPTVDTARHPASTRAAGRSPRRKRRNVGSHVGRGTIPSRNGRFVERLMTARTPRIR